MSSKTFQSAFNSRLDMSNFAHGGILDVMPGDGVTIDKTTDPQRPVISFADQQWQGVRQVLAGSNITVTGTTTYPIINSTATGGGGSGDQYWHEGDDEYTITPIVPKVKVDNLQAGVVSITDYNAPHEQYPIMYVSNSPDQLADPPPNVISTTEAVSEYIETRIADIPAPLWQTGGGGDAGLYLEPVTSSYGVKAAALVADGGFKLYGGTFTIADTVSSADIAAPLNMNSNIAMAVSTDTKGQILHEISEGGPTFAMLGYHEYTSGWKAVEVGNEEHHLTLNTYDAGDAIGDHILVNCKNGSTEEALIVAYMSDVQPISENLQALTNIVDTKSSIYVIPPPPPTIKTMSNLAVGDNLRGAIFSWTESAGTTIMPDSDAVPNDIVAYFEMNNTQNSRITYDTTQHKIVLSADLLGPPNEWGLSLQYPTMYFMYASEYRASPIVFPNDADYIITNIVGSNYLQLSKILLPSISVEIVATGQASYIDCQWLYTHGTWTAPPSQTITHRTNITDFAPEKLGCFCETTGELANVYGADYEPTLTRATDAITKVRPANALTNKIMGIITDERTIASHGDVLCVVVQNKLTQNQDGTTTDEQLLYNVGDLLVPDITGLCRVATKTERKFAMINQITLPRITAVFPGREFVACFMN